MTITTVMMLGKGDDVGLVFNANLQAGVVEGSGYYYTEKGILTLIFGVWPRCMRV